MLSAHKVKRVLPYLPYKPNIIAMIEYRYFYNKKVKEIAKCLDIPEVTCYNQINLVNNLLKLYIQLPDEYLRKEKVVEYNKGNYLVKRNTPYLSFENSVDSVLVQISVIHSRHKKKLFEEDL